MVDPGFLAEDKQGVKLVSGICGLDVQGGEEDL
jgi:hypothetical protein